MNARHGLIALTFGALMLPWASGATVAEPISDKFDGTYQGEASVVDQLSQGNCRGGQLHDVRIEKGLMRGGTVSGDAGITGFVTSGGFFTGKYRMPDGAETRFEGLIDNGVLVGGIIEDDRCAWLLELSKKG